MWVQEGDKEEPYTKIIVNRKIANNGDILRQTLAHEIIHHHLYQKYGNSVAKHGEHFNLIADRINAKEGVNFVSQFADQTDFKPNASFKVKSNLENLPEIKWSYPTDSELLNEIRTEFDIEKLLIDEMWPTVSHYTDAIDDLKKVSKPEKLDPKKLKGRHVWKTYDDLVRTVTNFGGPKDPDAMLDAIRANKPLPMPIVIRKRDGTLSIAGGATRSGIALLAGQEITALVVDEKQANELMADRLEQIGEKEAKEEGLEKLYAVIKNYFLFDGPKPVIAKEDKFRAHLISYRYERIARLRGMDSSDKHLKFNDFLITSDFKTTEKKFLNQGASAGEIKEYLNVFKNLRDKNKIKKVEEKNIDFWGKKSWEDFKKFVDKTKKEKSVTEEKKLKKIAGAELVAENDGWYVYHITTHEACMLYGSGTKWCITEPDGIHWKEYSLGSNIYFILSKNLSKKDSKFYKIAVTVDTDGKIIFWDSLDGYHTEIPRKLGIPKAGFKEFDLNSKSEEVQLEAIRNNVHAIQYIENQSEKMQLEVVNRNPYMLPVLVNPSDTVKLAAVKENGQSIRHIQNPSEGLQLAAIAQDEMAIRYIDNPSEKVQLVVVEKNGHTIQYINNPNEKVQLAAVTQNGLAIKHIESPSESVQFAAVKEFEDAIRYIENPSEAVQLQAVKQHGLAIQYIKNPTDKVKKYFEEHRATSELITADFKIVKKKFVTDQGIEVDLVDTYLDEFKELRDKNKIKKTDEKDIDFWGKKSWEEFKSFVDSLKTEKSKTEEKKLIKVKGAELLAENKLWSVYRMTTHKACQIYGSGTKWCLTEDFDTAWKEYSQKNNIYFILSKTRPKEDPWYKIALLVDRKGEVNYWNALDEPYAELPKGFNFNIPKFKTEKAKKKELDEDLWDYGVRFTYHRYMEDLCRHIADHDTSYQDAYFTKELAEKAMRRFNASSFTEACEKAIHYHEKKANEYYAKVTDKDLWSEIFVMFFEGDIEKAWDREEIGEEANNYIKLTPQILDELDI